MKNNYEYIVLGLGGIGSSALYWLSRAGVDVLGLEQFHIGHVFGGSQDHSRIIRLSYHTPEYVKLAQHAYQSWAILEEEAEEQLIVKTGGLDFTHPDTSIPITDYTNSLDSVGIPYEMLSADEMMYRWPQFQLTDEIRGLYQSESGIAPAAKCMAAHLRMARHYGATLRDNAPVETIREVGNEIEVVAGGVTYRCRKLVIAAGAWSNHALANFGMKLPLTITQEQVTYYDTPHKSEFMPDRFPIWIWMDEPCYYGFPVYGENGTKVAQDVGGETVTPETRTFEPNPAAQKRVDDFTKRYIPNAFGPYIYTKTCLYTMPPDRDFILSTLPTNKNVSIAIGGGHVFKFTSIVGRILSELSMYNETAYHIDPFRIDRPVLLEENPATQFMV